MVPLYYLSLMLNCIQRSLSYNHLLYLISREVSSDDITHWDLEDNEDEENSMNEMINIITENEYNEVRQT